MKKLSLRPGLWINHTNSKANIPIFDYKSSSKQPTLAPDPNQTL